MIKKNIGQDLFRYKIKDYKFCCFDMESCNLNLAIKNRPWEIGYITVEKGEVTSEHNRRIWWEDLNISEDAARITRFDYQDYKNTAEDPKEILSEFEAWLYDPKVINITYNGLGFDAYLHQLWREELGLKKDWSFLPRSIDVLALSRAYKLGLTPPDHWESFMCWQQKLINYFNDERLRKERKKNFGSTALGKMAKEFGIDVDEEKTHSGLYDVILTWKIFEQLLWKMEISENCVLTEK